MSVGGRHRPFDPHDRVAVVTGASSGIGGATALRLARLGMRVVAVARRGDRLASLAATEPRIRPAVVDVTDGDAVAGLAASVAGTEGACHVLVNNAGVRGGPLDTADDVAESLRVLDINLLGPVRVLGAFADLLAASAPSHVVNVASVAGKLGVGSPAYAASKFGLVGLTEAAAGSWARRGVRLSQLNPGFVETEGFPQRGLLTSPLGRLVATPEDVARAVQDVLVTGAHERTVPRWYRGLVVARHLAAPLFRAAVHRVRRPGDPHRR